MPALVIPVATSPPNTPEERFVRVAKFILIACVAACDSRKPQEDLTEKTPDLLSAAEIAQVDSLISHPLRLAEDEFGQPIDTIDRRELLRLLRAAQYDSLENILNERWQATQRDIKNEARLRHVYDSFLHSNAAYEGQLRQWIAARPNSAPAWIAMTKYYEGRTLQARGRGTIFVTKAENFERAREHADEGMRTADQALKLAPGHLTVYIAQLALIQFGGATESARAPSIIEAAINAHPASYELRYSIMWMILPRWGGSHDAMTQFASMSAGFVAQNPKLRVLAGMVAQDQADDEDHEKALALLDQAAANGHYYSLHVDYAERYSAQEKLIDALAAYQRALALSPQGRNAVDGRAGLLVEIGTAIADSTMREKVWAEAERAIKLMRDLRFPNTDPSGWLETLGRARERCAKDPPRCRKVY